MSALWRGRLRFYGLWYALGVLLVALGVARLLSGQATGWVQVTYGLVFGLAMPLNLKLAFQFGYNVGISDGFAAGVTGSGEFIREPDPAAMAQEGVERARAVRAGGAPRWFRGP